MTIKVISSYEDDLENLFADAKVLAIDVEGVDLCRNGEVSLIQIADSEKCVVFDVLKMNTDDPLVNWLRKLIESAEVVKVLHDMKMDFDALHHLLNIRLCNVHDTAIWHSLITGVEDTSLNTVLQHNGIRTNVQRDKSVYQSNHAFWAARPLTNQMIEWASGDVSKLIDVYNIQSKNDRYQLAADRKVSELMQFFTECNVGIVQVRNKGHFIGRGGSNLRHLQRTTNTFVYQWGNRSADDFMVFYKNASSLEKVRKEGQVRTRMFDYF